MIFILEKLNDSPASRYLLGQKKPPLLQDKKSYDNFCNCRIANTFTSFLCSLEVLQILKEKKHSYLKKII